MGETNGIMLATGSVSASLRVDGLEQLKEFARLLSKAPPGAVPEQLCGSPEAIFAVLATGIEMGVGPMESIRSIHMVEGKPTLGASLMLAQAIRRGVRIQWVRKDAEMAHAKFTRAGFPDHEEKITMAEIKAGGIDQGKNGVKKNWRSFPVAMLTARCVSRALTSWAPDVLGAGVYVEGEIEEPAANTRGAIDAEIVDPVAAEFERIGSELDAAETEAEAIAAWEPYAVARKRLTPEQRTVLMAKKEAAKARLAPVDPEEADRRALLEQEKQEAGVPS